MPYTVNAFRTTIYRAGSYRGNGTNAPATRLLAGGALDPGDDDQHGMVPAGRRVSATDAVHPDGSGRVVSFQEPNGAGDAVFLPFFANNICSAVLPTAAGSNVDTFFTAEMSGCSIFIDRVTAVPAPVGGVANPIAVGDLVVYHANAMSRSANAATVLANPAATANVPARNHMRNVHYARAAASYTNNAPGPGLTLQRVALCERGVYMQVVEGELARKRAMGRTNVLFSGGTNVMGFRVGAGWQFWFQTWGWVTYDRPASAGRAARLFRGAHKTASGPARIWDVGQIL